MSEDKILERVRKMLALANNESATEGERDTAMQMAHNLMAKHQLDMLDISEHIRDQQDPRMHFQEEGWNLIWTQQIRQSVAKLFGVKYFIGKKINATRGTHYFVGRESAATTAMLLCDWIVRDSLRKADKFGGHRLNPAGRAFGIGVANALAGRVWDMLKDKADEIKESTGRDLVVIMDDEQSANEDYIEDVLGVKLKSRSLRKTKVDLDGFAAGHEHGKTINLSTHLANKKGTLALR